MSGSNWGPITTSVNAVFAVVFICLFALAVWNMSASYTRNSIDAGRNTAEDSKNTKQKIESTCIATDRTAFSECVYEIVKTTNDAQRAEEDLSAQKDMAEWAFWMLTVSGLGIALTVVGIYFVRENLREMQLQRAIGHSAVEAAKESNTVARKIGEAQVRAYVVCEEANCKTTKNTIELWIKLKNYGQTPAKNIQIESYLQASASDPQGNPSWRFRNYKTIKMEGRAPNIAAGASDFGLVIWMIGVGLEGREAETIRTIIDERLEVHPTCKLSFDDVFGENHTTEFVLNLSSPNMIFAGEAIDTKKYYPYHSNQ